MEMNLATSGCQAGKGEGMLKKTPATLRLPAEGRPHGEI